MSSSCHAHLDCDQSAVVIENLTVRDKDVAREAQRWTAGERGPVVDDPAALAAADLTAFVTEAVKIGAHALSATGQSQDARALELMVKEVGEKAENSTTKAAELTERAVTAATETVAKAAKDAKTAIVEADAASRKEFVEAVAAAKEDLTVEVRRIFGGDSPELLERLRPLLDKFGTDLDAKSRAGATELLEKAVKQFDPSDPTSPMAKHAADLTTRQRELTELIDKNHDQLDKKLDDLTVALKLQEARTSLSKVTPIKGDTFENQVNVVVSEIAAGLGDEYVDTRATVGSLSRSKKGDGVLTVDGGAARVVLEMTDSARTGWAEYLNEAERNRQAVAALGLVRTTDQNGGQSIRVLGPRRIVLAFDPMSDDPDLVRTVLMLLRTAALAAQSRRGAPQMATAEEKITEAVAQLERLEDVKKTAGSIQKNAMKIESSCTGITSSIQRLLTDALVSLNEARDDAPRSQADAVA
ncbi:Fis family transcriptional regulator [Mycobacterium sp. RTGN5]|uniref:Fis family transcriptional regulator n=1 Tax=Mycobacterium sp. RTGN5 TaxID=3016522 RepID=UPI0029C6DF6F|nr:Fis family transcriptional regulator [Mycobacterium sp. RTGN5]